ncbi:MAG: restriction endonuclease [Candidatus Aenigmarchaeota archaeon]|nr:restriction endonuclease [Candidatus Aenigmarchaeota archaeon]
MWIVKASGRMEKFNINKVKRTCIRAGVSRDDANKIANQVAARVRSGMSTRDILNITLSLLKKKAPQAGIKYDLKGALMRLGPAGFIFEELVSQILKEYGYTAKVHSLIKGGSGVIHEVDIVAGKPITSKSGIESGIKYYSIECKYHNAPGIYTGLKDVLYTYARFLDLQDGFKKGYTQKFDQPWLCTNTKFSSDVISYALSKNIRLLSWDYPAGESLSKMIEDKKLYPITMLRNLDTNTQGNLAKSNIIFCKTLVETKIEKLNQKTGISIRKLKELREQAAKIC